MKLSTSVLMMSYNYNGGDLIEDLIYGISQVSISNQKRQKQKAKSQKQLKLFGPQQVSIDRFILNIHKNKNCCESNYVKINEALTYGILDKNSYEYKEIKSLFAKSQLIIKSIKKVYNPYLDKAFEIKRLFHYGNVNPQRLFHGTKQVYVDNICTYNFNWRFSGLETGHKFGKGVNFSRTPFFAAFFCDRGIKKVIIIVDVLMKNIVNGNENLLVPPKGFDTTRGKNGTVLVKFYDNEFCPRYVVNALQIRNQN